MLSWDVAIASIWIGCGLLKSIVYLWVCTSDLGQHVRGETIALLTNRLNARHKHGVFRLRICSWTSFARQEWGSIYDFLTLWWAILLVAICVAWWGKVWLVQSLSLMFMTDVFHFILVGQEDRRHSIRVCLLLCLVSKWCSFASNTLRVVYRLESFGSQTKTRVHRMVDAGLINAIIVLQVIAWHLASQGCFMFETYRQHWLCPVLLELIDLALKVNIDGAKSSVTIWINWQRLHHWVITVIYESTGFERGTSNVFHLWWLLLLLYHGLWYFRIVNLLHCWVSIVSVGGPARFSGVLRSSIVDRVVAVHDCVELVSLQRLRLELRLVFVDR